MYKLYKITALQANGIDTYFFKHHFLPIYYVTAVTVSEAYKNITQHYPFCVPPATYKISNKWVKYKYLGRVNSLHELMRTHPELLI